MQANWIVEIEKFVNKKSSEDDPPIFFGWELNNLIEFVNSAGFANIVGAVVPPPFPIVLPLTEAAFRASLLNYLGAKVGGLLMRVDTSVLPCTNSRTGLRSVL
jgi:hypothetical protein